MADRRDGFHAGLGGSGGQTGAVPAGQSLRGDRPLPGGADPGAVGVALAVLSRRGPRAVPGGALGPLSTYRVGGAAAVLVSVTGVADLTGVADAVRESGLPVLVVGRGSNLLVADSGFGGIALILDPVAFGEVEICGTSVRAGAAMALPTLARRTAEAGLHGFEWAVGVPGSVGGAVRMNAGGHGSEMARILVSATVADVASGDGTPQAVPVAALRYRYRQSSIEAHHVVLDASLELEPGDAEAAYSTIRDIVRWRREHQPGGQNAGSVFTNPPGALPTSSAGWLIEQAGLKGCRYGSAMVSPKHANFIQADQGGSADDVHQLLLQVRAAVLAYHGVELRTEVRLIGFPSQSSTNGGDFT